jgi:sugar phosphate permease
VFIALGGALGVGGWHTPFWVYAISLLIGIPMIFALWEPRVASRDVAADRVPIPWRRIGGPLVVTLFAGFSFYVIIIEVAYLIVGTGVAATNTAVIGAIAASASLATAIGGLLFVRAIKVGVPALLPITFALQAVGMLIIWFVPGLAGIAVGAVIASFGSGMLLPTLLRWVVATTEFAERGRVTGLWTSAFFLGQFLTPILIAGVAAAAGSLPSAVGFVGVAAIVVAVIVGSSLRRGAAIAQAPAV